VLKLLRSEGCPWNERTCSAAAEGGHLEVLKRLRIVKAFNWIHGHVVLQLKVDA